MARVWESGDIGGSASSAERFMLLCVETCADVYNKMLATCKPASAVISDCAHDSDFKVMFDLARGAVNCKPEHKPPSKETVTTISYVESFQEKKFSVRKKASRQGY